MFKKIFIIILLSGFALSEGQAKWEIEPLYSAEYQPRMIKEGFQMTHALSFARSNPDLVYLCTDTSRVWRSTDRGQSWTQRSNGMISNGCRSLLVDPANPDRVVAAGFLGVFAEKAKNRKFQHQGIYLTENGGREWSLVGETPFYRQVSKAPLIAINSSTIGKSKTSTWYAGSFDGLYMSTDAGLSWNRVSPNIDSICAVEEVSGQPGNLFIAAESGLFLYDKTKIVPIGRGLPKNTCSITSHPNGSGIVLAANGKKGVFRSTDGGLNFKPSNTGLPLFKANITSLAFGNAPPYLLFAKSHQSPFRVPFYSHDTGKTWKQGSFTASSSPSSAREHFWFSSAIAPDPDDGNRCLIVSSGDGKVFETIDGGESWQLYGSGYTGARVMEMAFDKNSVLLALTDFGLWMKRRDEKYFYQIETPSFNKQTSAGLITQLQDGSKVITVGNWVNQCIAKQEPNGDWKMFPKLNGLFKNINRDPANDKIVYIDNFRSTDGGDSWQQLSRKVMEVSNTRIGRIFALEEKAKSSETRIVFSDDKGDTWAPYTKPIRIGANHVNDLVIDPFDNNRIYLGTSDGIWIYDGQTWRSRSQQSGLVPDEFNMTYISSLVVDPKRKGHVFAGRAAPGRGASNGIFHSIDSGETWTNISSGLSESMFVWSLHFDQYESVLYAGTDLGLIKLKAGNPGD